MLSFFLDDQLLTATRIDVRSVKVTVPSHMANGTYTLRMASSKHAHMTLFSQSITIHTPTPQPVVNGKIAFMSYRDGNGEVLHHEWRRQQPDEPFQQRRT
jgi:hypothetical protein